MAQPREEFSCLCSVYEVEHEGKLRKRLKVHDEHGVTAFFSQFGAGEDLELTIATISQSKSAKQRRFFHGPVLAAFLKLGYRKQEAKDMLCLTHIPQTIKLPDGSFVRVPGHTEALSREEYSAFIEACIQQAAELGEYVKDSAEWRASQQQLARKRA